jgi:microcystin-dependent protein
VAENASVVDGTVTWTVRKIGSGGGEAVGVIKAFAGNGDIPSGYLLCDGSAVSRTMFPDLFSAIGTTYGSGDGSTTFNVPDFNTAARFAQGGTVAGVEKEAGLPNITGALIPVIPTSANDTTGTMLCSEQPATWTGGNALNTRTNAITGKGYFTRAGSTTTALKAGISLDASASNPIYGNSSTVQPYSLTVRYIIKAFDGQTADSALIDITQYAQELAGKANITGSNLVHHRDVITTSGTYTAPVTGLYKITVKGGGGGGQGGQYTANGAYGGAGGGEGGTTIAYDKMTVGDTATVVVGAGGSGGTGGSTATAGSAGGNSIVTVNSNTYTGGGGLGGNYGGDYSGGLGGSGDVVGMTGCSRLNATQGNTVISGQIGGGNRVSSGSTVYGAGGSGGNARYQTAPFGNNGTAGADGFVLFEYVSAV